VIDSEGGPNMSQQIQDSGRPQYRNISTMYWPILMKFGTVVDLSPQDNDS